MYYEGLDYKSFHKLLFLQETYELFFTIPSTVYTGRITVTVLVQARIFPSAGDMVRKFLLENENPFKSG